MVFIYNPILSTWIIGLVLVCLLIFTARLNKSAAVLSPAVTKELKGVAIFMVVFSHIGYFLSNDHRFLYPLSIMAGVGVNLFLFLSAYGLSVSNIKHQLGILQWYRKRLPKLFIPLWIVVISFFLMDYFILKRHYSSEYVLQAFIGYFPRADVYRDLDSVLWYFSLILFYYLLFPLTFYKKHLWISALLLLLAGGAFIHWNHHVVSPDALTLYKIHYFAFPLGVMAAWAFSTTAANTAAQYLNVWVGKLLKKPKSITSSLLVYLPRYLVVVGLMVTIGYLAIHSAVGESPQKEQFVSICTMALIVLLFIVKKVEFRFLSLFGLFSYEIYLFHWPLLSRYDILYSHMPPWLATLAWLGIFIMVSWIFSKVYQKLKLNIKP